MSQNDKTTNTKAGEAIPHRGKIFIKICQSHRLVTKTDSQDEDWHHQALLNDTFLLQSDKTANAEAGLPFSLPRQEDYTLPELQARDWDRLAG